MTKKPNSYLLLNTNGTRRGRERHPKNLHVKPWSDAIIRAYRSSKSRGKIKATP